MKQLIYGLEASPTHFSILPCGVLAYLTFGWLPCSHWYTDLDKRFGVNRLRLTYVNRPGLERPTAWSKIKSTGLKQQPIH